MMAHCLTNPTHPLAVVDVWFVDPAVVDSSDRDSVPDCCHPDDQEAGSPTVVYSFKIFCESTCIRPQIRDLGDSIKPSVRFGALAKPDGVLEGMYNKLCSVEHYPCGDDGNSVHVCHYSPKDGYQTYCVPEADSDVVAYFPKDYCGPCVGGYGNIKS